MKRILFALLIISNCWTGVYSQSEKTWKLGIKTTLDFNYTPPIVQLDTSVACMDDASTSISSPQGNLLFYSNGFEVYSKNFSKLPNGKNFNAGLYSNPYYSGGCYPLIKASIFLPFPDDTNKYYLFYENMQYKDGGNNYLPDKLRFLTINKLLNNGLGDVVIKDSTLISIDTIEAGNILSLKHADGVSYWVLARKYHSNQFYRILVDSFGVHRLADQFIGSAYIDSFSIMSISNASIKNDKVAYVYQSYHTIPNMKPGQIDLFDFDRCTGTLYNYKKIMLNYNTDTVYAVSVCLSPSGRYLYATDQFKLWQFDLQSSNIYNSKVLIGSRLAGQTYIFWQMKNAVDGKIYLSNGGSTKSMHVINAPDSFGLACNFVQKQIVIPSGFFYADGGLPNEPNFTLGAINCSVGIEPAKQFTSELSLFPNPANESVVVSYSSFVNSIELYDLLGILYETSVPNNSMHQTEINVSALNSGIYLIKVTDKDGNISVKKLVKE